MKALSALLAAATVGLVCATASAPVEAGGYPGYYRHGGHGHWHGGHGHWRGGYWGGYWGPRYWGPWYGGYWGGGYWGPGWGWGYWGGPPAVAYSPVVVPEARVYVERDEATPPAQSDVQWWYWCASSRAYYPYVNTCSEGWQRVPPQPVQAPR
jgi:hypothetical protein